MSLINANITGDFLSKLPYEVVVLILTQYTGHCVVRENRLLFINQFTEKQLENLKNILSIIPKIKYRITIPNIQYNPTSIVNLDICKRLITQYDLENHNIKKYFNCRDNQNELCKVYIHKSYTIRSATDFLGKHSRRLCILYFYKDDEEFPYTSRTFSLPASELEIASDLDSDLE